MTRRQRGAPPQAAPATGNHSRKTAAATALAIGTLIAVAAVAPLRAEGLSPEGLWQAYSDKDGKASASIRISSVNGEYRGVIEQLNDPAKRADICEKCSDERHNHPIVGLTILTGLHKDGDRYVGGKILDPDNGFLYSCRMMLLDGGKRLEVRGYLGFSLLGRSQVWVREQ